MDDWILANALLEFFGIDEKVDQTVDATVYLVMALSATALFMIKIGLMLLGSDDGGDFDTDVDGDFHHAGGDSDAAFSAFSLLSILAFFMGAGWMGLTCRLSWGFGGMTSVLIATTFGVGLMMLASLGMFYVKKLNVSPTVDIASAVGRTANVYLTIPARGEGTGQVEVDVSGIRKVLPAVSTDGKIEAFTAVKVIDIRDDETLIVEPLP